MNLFVDSMGIMWCTAIYFETNAGLQEDQPFLSGGVQNRHMGSTHEGTSQISFPKNCVMIPIAARARKLPANTQNCRSTWHWYHNNVMITAILAIIIVDMDTIPTLTLSPPILAPIVKLMRPSKNVAAPLPLVARK